MEYMAGNTVMDRVVEGGLEKDAKVIMKQLLQGDSSPGLQTSGQL